MREVVGMLIVQAVPVVVTHNPARELASLMAALDYGQKIGFVNIEQSPLLRIQGTFGLQVQRLNTEFQYF